MFGLKSIMITIFCKKIIIIMFLYISESQMKPQAGVVSFKDFTC